MSGYGQTARSNFTNIGRSPIRIYAINQTGMEGDLNGKPFPTMELAPGATQMADLYRGSLLLAHTMQDHCAGIVHIAAGTDQVDFLPEAAVAVSPGQQAGGQQGPGHPLAIIAPASGESQQAAIGFVYTATDSAGDCLSVFQSPRTPNS